MDRGKITGIEFDVLRSHDILKLSVVEDSEESAFGPILKPKDLYDARFGIPNESRVCQTCGGTRRGVCDAPHSCDGHFGHVELPSAIYHPYHVRRVVKLLSKICLGCSKALRKKGRANFLLLDSDRDSQESGTVKEVPRKRKLSETQADKKVPKNRKRSDLLKWLNAMRSEEDVPVKEEIYDHVYAAENGSWQSSVAKSSVPTPPVICVKEELIDDITDPVRTEPPMQKELVHDAGGRSNTKDGTKCGTSGGFNGPDKSGPKDAEEVPMKPREESEDSPPVQPGEEIPEGSIENSCKYCGVNRKELGLRFPKINLRVVTKVKRSGKIETIKMVVEEKPGDSQLPGGFWDFVNGHPASETEKSRLLLPFEALNILRRVPVEDHARLNMDKVVTHPEAFILFTIPVTPNCNRLIMDDWNSTLMPRIILGRGGPNRNLEALVSKVKQIASCVGKKTFETEVLDVDELQLLVARHLRACKVVEFSSYSKQETVEKQEGRSLELKWLKTHVLSKRSNYSARTIVNGDPNISIEEIGVPYEMALHLTLDERVNRLNLRKWQKVISDIKGGRMVSPPGPVLLRTRNRLFDLREKCLAWTSYVVKVGDVLTRCLQNGDYVFANRPPSLHKHSLIALKVKLHHQLTFAINPLICAPFDGDFDGDAFHVYVPQSVESMAELRELMSVSAQMVCPQGGQAMISLTQDTLLGGHMITRSHSFLNQAEMSQLSMFCSAGMPPPAIVKSPARTGPLWTGKQLYGMTFPRLDYGSPDGDVFIRHGEILICKGNSGWLGASVNGIVKAICEFAGSDAALHYLNSAQALLHQWFMSRGFSVGLKDFYVARNRESRSTMVHGVRKCLRISEEASLRQVLKLDKTVQARILSPKPNRHENVEYIKHGGCFGLLLGDSRRYTKIKDLQRSAIEKFQSLVPIVDNLIYGYMDSDNSLLAMVRSGSKGSMSRLIQQTACLGLQLYKGESLISVKDPNNKLFYYNQSLKFRREDVFDNKDEIICQPGYWESKGIIASSFFDGLNPAEFYLHALSSRGSMLREGIEEPNKIMRNLFLFMRDLYVAYDGSVRSRSGNRVIQFQYGGLRADDCREAAYMAGEPVGALAATAVAEPSYSVKMDAYHSSSLLKAGPIQLLQETLFPRRKSTLKMRDRSVILRLYPGFGVQRRALRLKRELEKVPFSKFVSSLALEFSGDGGSYEKVYYEKTKPSYEIVKRSCPWQCRVLLNKKALRDYELDVSTVKTRLNREFNSATSREALPSIVFVNQFICTSRGQSGIIDECLVFFLHESGNEAPLSTTPASDPIKVGKETVPGDMLKQGKQEKQKISFERMINVIIPRILVTTVKGNDDIEVVKLVWEDTDGASRAPKPSHYPRFTSHRSSDTGELCLEVHTNKMKGAGKRGAAYSAVKSASVLFLDEIDWARSTPYSIQEITHVFGVEAARQSMKKRLGLATKDMGKPVREEHLTLVADTMTFSGEVVGLSLSGYRDYCKDPFMSTPFMEASFQEPKKNFFEMAVVGARDNLDGALACAVWGRRIPLGTGADFDALPMPALKYEVQSNDSHEKSGSAKRSRAEVETENEGKACCAREGKNGLKDGLHKSLFRSSLLSAVKEAQSNHDNGDFRPGSTSPFKKRTGTILNGMQEEKGSTPNGTNSAPKLPGGHRRHLSPMMDAGSCKQTLIKQPRSGVDGLQMFGDFSKDVEIDKELFQKLQNLLHERYEAGEIVDKESEKMLLEEVLIHHPRRKEKIGCGVSFIKVDYHPEYPTTKCFHIVRIDGSTCDFSYRKCLQNTYSRFPA